MNATKPVQKSNDWVNGLVVVRKPNRKLHYVSIHNFWTKQLNRNNSTPLPPPLRRNIIQNIRGILFFKTRRQFRLLANYFKRLPYAIDSTIEVFQRKVTLIISDVPGSTNFKEEFAVFGKNLQEHDSRLKKAFLKIRKSGLNLNKTKYQTRKQLIVFLEHIISLMNYRDFLVWLIT